MSPQRGREIRNDAPLAIAIIRGPDAITARINQRGADNSFEVVPLPIGNVTRALYPAWDRLHESWLYLSRVKAVDAQTLFHIFVVLLETVPDLSSESVPGPLPVEWNVIPPPLRATQTHPRAFKGTKRRPPKERALPATDLRAYLCNPRSLRELMSPLMVFLPSVLPRLVKAGYDAARVDAVERELLAMAPRKAPWSLPSSFVQCIWPSIRTMSSRDLSRHLAVFTQLAVEDEPRLLGSFTRLVALAGAEAGYTWGRVSLSLDGNRRATFIEKLLETQAYASAPTAAAETQLEEISRLTNDEQFAIWVREFLAATHGTDYLLAGLRLAAQCNPHYRLESVGSCENFPFDEVEEIASRLVDDASWLPLTLWERCGRFPGLADAIRNSRWRDFHSSAAYAYLRFLVGIDYWDLQGRAVQTKWRVVARELPRIEEFILASPAPYQQKVVECIADWLAWWNDPATIRARLHNGCLILRRLAASPFRTSEDADDAIMYFLELENEADLQRFLTAPDASFQALEHACRRDNDTRLIARGLEQLTRLHGHFAVDAFTQAPAKLARIAKSLGSVSAPVQSQIVARCMAHPLHRIDPFAHPVREICAVIITHCTRGLTNPIPARLAAWFRGEIELTQAQLERHRRVMAEKLILTRLDLIEHTVVDWLKRGFPVERLTGSNEHALRVLSSVRENRRGLRKFLRAYWSGDQHYLASHPETLAWYRKHNAVSPAVWEQGIAFQSSPFSIQLERDPFEVLKLGTYVGSCLGVGGSFTDSAVAALLDVNKQVLYARDQKGRVVARQLVAISDNDQLVCFSVYPHAAGKHVKTLFREYDHAFAEALGLPLYVPRSDDAGYRISSVLSVYWWDDDSWDFEVS